MSRPCAYCKEMGHHIRDCLELAEKNRRQAMKMDSPQRVEQKKIPTPVYTPKNAFANLYSSSDDEQEEGEIVETRSNEEASVSSDGYWSRSGIKNVNIQSSFYSSSSSNNSSDDEDAEYPEYIHQPSAAWIKYQGWSWVDIEYDSE